MKYGWLVRLVLTVAVPAVLAAPRAARACGSAVYLSDIHPAAPKPTTPNRPLLVAQAERELSEGRPEKAAARALEAFPALKIIKMGTLPLADRALRVVALAQARTEGKVGGGGFLAKTAPQRGDNMLWSVAVLRGLNDRHTNNPAFQSDLGEALARVPAARVEAARMLGDLADRDLLTTAEGYAALARLRAERGDGAGREALVKRCQTMTKTPGVCAVNLVLEAPRAEG